MGVIEPLLSKSWRKYLDQEFSQEYMVLLKFFLQHEIQSGKTIYPRVNEYFKALNLTPFDKVKVIIIGQDPYHGSGQAHGLSFSVNKGVSIPPSLLNIYKELESDLGITPASHGSLESWAMQGVLLLNSVLTVEHKKPGAHQGHGWEQFTDRVILQLNEKRKNLVFVLWGAHAQKKGKCINEKCHQVIRSAHPSPLSAYRGFFGSSPFSKINKYLVEHAISPINWNLSLLE